MIRRPRAALCAVTTALSLYALLLVVSCTSDSFTSLQPAELRISANVQSTPIASLVVTVSASDINPSLVFNLTLESGIASGTLRVPAGAARTFTLRAFDATGLETHRGATTIDIVAGPNPTIAVLLHPIAGQQPIEATFGTLTISIAAVPGGVGQQESVQLTATVTGPGGPIAVGPGDIRWATATPATLTVDPATGLAKGRAHGDARVVATYAGTAGVATIAVDPVIIAAGDIAECTGVPPVPGDAEKETAIIVDSLVGLVLPLGDNAYEDGTLDEYTNCYDKAWPFKNRSRPVPGNHEYNTPGATGYYDFWGDLAGERGKGYYSYELGKWHLIALNSELSSAAMTAQLAWLQTDLSLTTAKCVLAYWHRPRFSSGERHGNDTKVAGFWDRLYAAGAEVILTGHEHLYERFAPQTPTQLADPVNGIRQFISGGGGASLYNFVTPRQPNSEVGLRRHGVLRMVLGAQSYSWKFIGRGAGLVEDSGTGACH